MGSKTKRILIWASVGAGTVLVAGVVLLFVSFKTIEPVSRHEAVEIFQEEQKAADPKSDQSLVSGGGEGVLRTAGKRSRRGATAAAEGASGTTLDRPILPAPGTYFFQTDGYEQVGNYQRKFPDESSRIVTRHGANRWTVHHIFSDDHHQWAEYSLETDRQLMHSRRVKLFFTGPFERTFKFEPPVVSFLFPFTEGKSWSGSFTGEISGTYEARTIGLESVTIGGTKLSVWHNRFHSKNSGTIEGELTSDLWVSPELGIYTKEKTRIEQRVGPFEYVSEYVMTLKSTVPKTSN